MPVRQTSLEAYWGEVYPTLGRRQLEVLKVFQDSWSREGLTNMEVADILGLSINCITPRVFELRKKGLLIEERKRICSITKRKVISWSATKNWEVLR